MYNWDYNINKEFERDDKYNNKYDKRNNMYCKKHYYYKGKCKCDKHCKDDIIIKLLCKIEEYLEDIEDCTNNTIVDLLEEILNNMTYAKKYK